MSRMKFEALGESDEALAIGSISRSVLFMRSGSSVGAGTAERSQRQPLKALFYCVWHANRGALPPGFNPLLTDRRNPAMLRSCHDKRIEKIQYTDHRVVRNLGARPDRRRRRLQR